MSDSTAPSDIIRKATDILTSSCPWVKLYLAGDEAFGGVAVRWGRLTGLGLMVNEATITIFDMHDSSGTGPGPNGGQRLVSTLVDVDTIIDIRQDFCNIL